MPSENSTRPAANTYHYDPLDRLLGSASLQRFYKGAFLASGLQDKRAVSFLCHQSQPLAQSSEFTTLLAADQQHSVVAAMPGNPYISYGPYGQRPQHDDGLLGFNSELPDEVTGHYPLGQGHRWFSPALMCFTSPDRLSPFGKGGINAYCYCLRDPINRRDPSGKFSFFRQVLESALLLGDLASKKLPSSPTWKLGINQEFFDDALKVLETSAMPNKGIPIKGPKNPLVDFGKGPGEYPAPFSEKMAAVVRNKTSHGQPPLPEELTKTYMKTATEANTGEISSVTAHLSMIKPWKQHGGPAGFVATKLHFVSAAFAGAEEHARIKTGKALLVAIREA